MKFRASAIWERAQSKAISEGKPLVQIVINYILRSISSFFRRRLVLLVPNFDYMNWKLRGQEHALAELFFDRPPESTEFLWSLVEMERISSVLEIGSNSGNRLYEMANRYPGKNFVGVDINLSAVNVGNNWAKTNQVRNLNFVHADITSELFYELFRNRTFDLVFSWASLIYIHPTKIRKLIHFLLQISTQQLIIIEQNDSQLKTFPRYLGTQVRNEPTWVRNYGKILESGNSNKITQIEILPVPYEVWHPGGGWAKAVTVTLDGAKT